MTSPASSNAGRPALATAEAALRLADRVVAKASALKEAGRTARAPARTKRRRARANHVSLAPVRLGRDLALDVVERRVEDPYEPGATIPAAFNRRVDLLELERAHARVTPQEYAVGRLAQAVFERASGRIGSANWQGGDRVDAAVAHELSMIYAIEDARTVHAYLARITRALGPIDARLLQAVLGERKSFADVAAMRGRAGRQGTAYYADRFRDALETLVEAWAARGSSRAERDANDPWTDERRSTDRRKDELVRGERGVPALDEETDANGIVVAPGRGYRLASDPEARWTPRQRRVLTEAKAQKIS